MLFYAFAYELQPHENALISLMHNLAERQESCKKKVIRPYCQNPKHIILVTI